MSAGCAWPLDDPAWSGQCWDCWDTVVLGRRAVSMRRHAVRRATNRDSRLVWQARHAGGAERQSVMATAMVATALVATATRPRMRRMMARRLRARELGESSDSMMAVERMRKSTNEGPRLALRARALDQRRDSESREARPYRAEPPTTRRHSPGGAGGGRLRAAGFRAVSVMD